MKLFPCEGNVFLGKVMKTGVIGMFLLRNFK